MDDQGNQKESYIENFTIKITKSQKEVLKMNPSVAAELRKWLRDIIEYYKMGK